MRNSELKEEFLAKCNNRMKYMVEQASIFEDKINKSMFDFTPDEAMQMIKEIDETEFRPIKRVLSMYIALAIRKCYTTNKINVFDLVYDI